VVYKVALGQVFLQVLQCSPVSIILPVFHIHSYITSYKIITRGCIINPLNTELNPICHLLALLGGATIVVVSRLRVQQHKQKQQCALVL